MSVPAVTRRSASLRFRGRAWMFVVLCVSFVLASELPVAAAPPSQQSGAGNCEVVLVSATSDEVVLDIHVSDFMHRAVESGGTTYQRIALAYAGSTQEIGKPELPAIGRLVAIPPDASVDVEVTPTKTTVLPDYFVYPTQRPLPDQGQDENPAFAIAAEFYAADTIYPAEQATIDAPQTMRDLTVVALHIFPLQYNPGRRELLVTSEMRVRLHFGGGERSLVRDGGARADDAFADLCTEFVVNCPVIAPQRSGTVGAADSGGAEYLIVSAPECVTAAEMLAEWKNERGIRTVVRTTDDTGSTADAIKSYIRMAYDTWTPKPAYVLLLGDVESIPVHYVNVHPDAGINYPEGHKNGTDLYYATMGGDTDLLPDLHLGRIPVDSPAEATHVVAKIVAYETTPPADADFYDRAAVAAYFQDDNNNGTEDRLFVTTSEGMRGYLLTRGYSVQRIYRTQSGVVPARFNDGSPLPADLLKPGFAWDGDSADVIAAINAGAFLVAHRDHGSTSGWSEPGFYTSHIDSLANGAKLPVVLSINCESGYFDQETDDYGYGANPCFAEKLLRYGSGAEGGAVGVVAATRVSYSGPNDDLMNGFIDALWPEFLAYNGTASQRMGNVLTHGKYYLYSEWGPSTFRTTTMEIFHYLGDPTMALWTAEPVALTVTHGPTASTWDTEVPVFVDQTGATIAVSQDGAWFGTAASNGGWQNVSLRSTLRPGEAHITVTGDNYLPYRGTLDVEAAPPSCVVSLPAVFRGVQWPSLLLYDDFSEPASGWYVGSYPECVFEYIGGEYRLFVKQQGVYMFPSIAPLATNFSLEVDARYASDATGAYGLLFGGNDAMTQWYVFRIRESDFDIVRFNSATWTEIQPWTVSPYINSGTVSNHLQVVRDGTCIDVYINGHLVKTVYDGAYTGRLRLGLFARGWFDGDVNVDVRFDNYTVKSLGTVGVSAGDAMGGASSFTAAPFATGAENASAAPVP